MAEDVTAQVLALLRGAAPERSEELLTLWHQFALNFTTLKDKPGFDIKAGGFGSVIFTPRTIHQIWLLGSAGWRAFEAYGGILHALPALGLAYDSLMLADLPGQLEAEIQFHRAVNSARALNGVYRQSDFDWPAEVPEPGGPTLGSAVEEVTRDITSIAGAFIFLHETRHIILSGSGLEAQEEELDCDQFARDFLFDKIGQYASAFSKPHDKVLALRAMAVSVGLFVVLEVTPIESWCGSRSHPSVGTRWAALLESVLLDPDHWFWSFAASLILARLRFEHRGPERLDATDARELCLGFVGYL